MANTTKPATDADDIAPDEPVSPPRELPEAAKRALVEAEARRAERDRQVEAMPPEHGGRDGPEPVRYGDWEKKGIASDF